MTRMIPIVDTEKSPTLRTKTFAYYNILFFRQKTTTQY